VEDKGRDIAGGLKDAGKDIKSLANKENNKAQETGSRYIEKGQIVKKRFESKEVKVRKGDTLWALSRKYGVSFMIILLC
jgi:LysM repeat protein